MIHDTRVLAGRLYGPVTPDKPHTPLAAPLVRCVVDARLRGQDVWGRAWALTGSGADPGRQGRGHGGQASRAAGRTITIGETCRGCPPKAGTTFEIAVWHEPDWAGGLG